MLHGSGHEEMMGNFLKGFNQIKQGLPIGPV
jgi:hypothetical protein